MTEADDQRKLQALVMQVQSYQGALQEVARQATLIETAFAEMAETIKAIEELPKSKQSEAMVPIGVGVFSKADILDKKNVTIAIGAGVYVQKTCAEAKTYLAGRKARLEDNLKLLKGQAERISKELEAANKAAEELYVKLQGQ